MVGGWTPEVLELLEKLRINCINLHHYHRKSFFYYKSYSKYFRIPVLIMSSLNATASVGLQKFVAQKWISLTTCLIGMLIGTITAVEMYLNITANMDLEMKQAKEYYNLAIDIYRITRLPQSQRGEDGNAYLSKKYSLYHKLKESSNLLHHKMKIDTLGMIPKHTKNPDGSDGTTTPEKPDGDDGIQMSQLFGVGRNQSERFYNISLKNPDDLENLVNVN